MHLSLFPFLFSYFLSSHLHPIPSDQSRRLEPSIVGYPRRRRIVLTRRRRMVIIRQRVQHNRPIMRERVRRDAHRDRLPKLLERRFGHVGRDHRQQQEVLRVQDHITARETYI